MKFLSYIKRVGRYILKGIPNYTVQVEVKESSPTNHLRNRNVIVTGGSRGLGFYIAKKCISEGANVIITGRNESGLKEASSKLGEKCKYIVFDVRNINLIDAFLSQAELLFGNQKINALISNAGVSLHEKDFREVDEEGWDMQLDTNLKGNYFLVKKYIEYLERQKDTSGNIVVVTSERARRSDDIPYGLTKTATDSFIRSFASKVIKKGIRVNGVAPGVTVSEMTGITRDENLYADWMPRNRFFVPEEVAEVVNFMLSDMSNCITGEIIACNHGRHISTW